MSEVRERLARRLNAGLDAASGCAGCYLALILFGALPMIATVVWAIVGMGTGSDWAGAVAGIATAVWVAISAFRLAWGR